MNNYILKLIKETVNSEEEKNVDRLYRMVWINILERFKQNPRDDVISLLITKRANNYYNLLYFGNNRITEIFLEMNGLEQEILKKKLIDDGFIIDDAKISISRQKIISYASKTQKTVAVPEQPINMIDTFKIKKYK